jgi:hypothetical protein
LWLDPRAVMSRRATLPRSCDTKRKRLAFVALQHRHRAAIAGQGEAPADPPCRVGLRSLICSSWSPYALRRASTNVCRQTVRPAGSHAEGDSYAQSFPTAARWAFPPDKETPERTADYKAIRVGFREVRAGRFSAARYSRPRPCGRGLRFNVEPRGLERGPELCAVHRRGGQNAGATRPGGPALS